MKTDIKHSMMARKVACGTIIRISWSCGRLVALPATKPCNAMGMQSSVCWSCSSPTSWGHLSLLHRRASFANTSSGSANHVAAVNPVKSRRNFRRNNFRA